ncbi:DnaJ domain-containing protein [Halopiger goleimassiliensis]|uniref:DnaJ domain-containing protein n=1 Tax=Halopiger goleimassiliensis TaxID=1293048 RepID=UPI0006778F2F|nr:DnaJ domain-containing protein [Halopiger goleimassiliensis]
MGETYYEILGVDTDATQEEIRAAYRERVLETHPDHNDDDDAAEQFKRVARAEGVLTDEAERARYDRLDHDSYVRFIEGDAAAEPDQSTESTADRGPSEPGTATDGRRRATETTDQHGGDSAAAHATGGTASREATGTESSGSDRRRRRQRGRHRTRTTAEERYRRYARAATERQRRTDESTTDDETRRGRPFDSSSSVSSSDADGESSAFRYAVHDWENDVELEWTGERFSHSTLVLLGCLWLCYPILVVASLTPAFPPTVNAVVAACTLVLVAYVLTKPRVAIAAFGSWSLLFPIGLSQFGLSPATVVGAVVLGAAWLPFGYAVAFWWVLRP